MLNLGVRSRMLWAMILARFTGEFLHQLTMSLNGSIYLLVGRFSKTFQNVRARVTATVSCHIIEYTLLTLHVVDLQGTTGEAYSTSEEAFVVSIVEDH